MPHSIQTEDRYFRNSMYPYKEYRGIIYEPGRIARIRMNRPRYLNAQSHAMFGELEDAYDRASQDPECRVIVVSGEGRCWSAGDDTNGLTPESAPCLVTYETREQLLERFDGDESALWHEYTIEHDYYISWWMGQKLLRVPKPTIAMVHGYCIYGAFAHAMSCDIVFASEDALFLGGGPAGRTVYDIGPRKSLEIAYENRFVTANEALEIGMINRVFPDRETLEKATMEYAARVAAEVPSALLRTKIGYLNWLDQQGYTSMFDRRLGFAETWRVWAKDGHPMRYEGRGMARTPVAFYNLTQKLLSEGKEVPEHIVEALQRAVVRDDKGAWQKALHQPGRERDRVARAEASAKAWQDRLQKEGIKDIKERIADLLEEQGWSLPLRD